MIIYEQTRMFCELNVMRGVKHLRVVLEGEAEATKIGQVTSDQDVAP